MMKIIVTETLKKHFPYLVQYIEKYGSDDLASTFEVPPTFKNAEELYRYCLENEKKWREVVVLPKENDCIL